jgi:hypothetical protein
MTTQCIVISGMTSKLNVMLTEGKHLIGLNNADR